MQQQVIHICSVCSTEEFKDSQLLHVNSIMYSLMTPECLISWLLHTDMYNGFGKSLIG